MPDLHTLAQRGDVEGILARINESGESPDVKDERGRTALYVAAGNGHLEAVKTLIALGANADAE